MKSKNKREQAKRSSKAPICHACDKLRIRTGKQSMNDTGKKPRGSFFGSLHWYPYPRGS